MAEDQGSGDQADQSGDQADGGADDASVSDMRSCPSGQYLVVEDDAQRCTRCPALSWTCESLDAKIRRPLSDSMLRLDIDTAGYAEASLSGSDMSGGGSATPFERQGVIGEGIISFDLSEYAQSSKLLILSIELVTSCGASRSVRLNLSVIPREMKIESAFCV